MCSAKCCGIIIACKGIGLRLQSDSQQSDDVHAVVADSVFERWEKEFFQTTPEWIAQCYWRACVSELKSLKPGNVHRFSEGHGMTVEHFLASAYATAPITCDLNLRLGERIRRSIQATRNAVMMNTNLGTVLLCAPIAIAANGCSTGSLQYSISRVITESGADDAEEILNAIRIAAPSGLGIAEQHDVYQPAAADIHTIMKSAKRKDMIAQQYFNGFADIFDFGFERIEEGISAYINDSDIATRLYLGYLSSYPDSHVLRQHGESVADEVRSTASQLYDELKSVNSMQERLMNIDSSWKSRDINPGTSADLTVATLFAYQIENPAKEVNN